MIEIYRHKEGHNKDEFEWLVLNTSTHHYKFGDNIIDLINNNAWGKVKFSNFIYRTYYLFCTYENDELVKNFKNDHLEEFI